MRRYINTIKTLLSIANDRPFYVVQLFISQGLYSLTALLPPLATAGIIAVVTDNNFSGIWYYVVLYLVFFVIHYATLYWNYRIYTVLAEYYHFTIQHKLFAHIINHDSIFNNISQGEITDTCTDDIRYPIDVLDSASYAFTSLIQVAVIFVVFAYYNVFAALIALGFTALYLYYMSGNSKRVGHYYEGTRKYEDKVADIFSQMIINRRQVRTLNLLPSLNKRLDKTQAEWSEQYQKKRHNLTFRYSIAPSIIYAGYIIVYIVLGYLVVRGKITIANLVLLVGYFELVITSLDTALDYLLDLSNYTVRINRIKNILDYTSSDAIEFGDVTNDYINGSLVFKNVYYDFKDGKALDNVSFKIYPNEATAIVGPPGGGKTTVFSLLQRNIRVKSGSILMDDESIYNYNAKTYASNITLVSPKPFVFKMSIRENLALVDSNVNHQIAACKRVGVHKAIMALPKGYNTIIDDDTRLLTDGQKQLIAIARALLSRAEIILLDQVTNAVDPSTTNDIANLIKDLTADHTVVMITHKPEMMQVADRIIVLNNGKVSAQGTNESVYKSSKLYRELRNVNK